MARSRGTRAHLSRRQVLTGAAATVAGSVLVSCGSRVATQASDSGDADVALVAKVIRSEELLLDFGRDCRKAHPELGPFVAGWARRQAEHVAALRAALTESDPPRSRARTRVPDSPQAAARALMRLLARSERHRRTDCLGAASGELARLLGSMAAAHAVSVELVRPLT